MKVYHKCSLNSFTLNDVTDKNFEIGTDSAITIPTSTVTGATSGCSLEYTIEIYNPSSLTWTTITQANASSTYKFIVSSADLDDPTKNTFDIDTSDYATWAGTE